MLLITMPLYVNALSDTECVHVSLNSRTEGLDLGALERRLVEGE